MNFLNEVPLAASPAPCILTPCLGVSATNSLAELESRACQDNPYTFDIVYTRYARRLLGLIEKHIPNPLKHKADPEGVAQSVFASYFKRHERGEFVPNTWEHVWGLLTMLAVKKCKKRKRYWFQIKRHSRRDDNHVTDDNQKLMALLDSREPSPEEIVQAKELLDWLLDSVPQPDRDVVSYILNGHSLPEIARLSRRSQRTISRIRQGLVETLQSRLAHPEPNS